MGSRRKRKTREVVEADKTTCFRGIEQTVPDTGVAARQAIAITPGAIATAEGICDRASMQREASRA